MIAYDKIKLNNLLLTECAKYFKRCGLIANEDLVAIAVAKAYAYHRTNIFIRLGVLVLTMILAFCSCGLIVMFTGIDSSIEVFKISILFFAGLTIFFLEYFIKNKNNYASGIDDGLLYFALISLGLFLGLMIKPSTNAENILFFGILSIAGLAAFIRYTDTLAAVLTYCSSLAMCFYIIMLTGALAKMIMPFAIFIISLLSYLFIRRKAIDFKMRFYKIGFNWLQWTSLLSIYFSVNYFVVCEASVAFFEMILKPGEDIPLYFLFYFFTIAIPLVYVILGIKNKESIILNCGLILIVVSIATIRYYHQLIPIELALSIGGLLLISIAWYLFRLLKTPKYGFTIEEDPGNRNWFSKDVEAILISQSMAHQQSNIATDSLSGGGKFGGGGAGESF